jgi:hypothetical protein
VSVHDDAWLAGMYEGEGTLVIHESVVAGKSYKRATMRIVSTDFDVLDKVLEVAGMGRITRTYQYAEHHKPWAAWEVRSLGDVQAIVRRLRPFLMARRGARADEVLAMRPLDPTRPGRRGGRDPARLCRAGLHPMGGERYCRPCHRAKQKVRI